MPEPIEFHSVDALGAGAVGEPGQRAFYIQARAESAQLTVLLEKEQVALLAAEAVAFLDRIAEQYPEDPITLPPAAAELREPTVPLFRARLIGLGFDPERELVLIELRERAADDEDDEDDAGDEDDATDAGDAGDPIDATLDDDEGYVARIYATRPQVRAMAAQGAVVVSAGRPPCDLCGQPMDPSGHRCPRWSADEIAEVLLRGDLEIVGRMRFASNGAFFVRACAAGVDVPAVYKPRRGERPLWDFPDGTLYRREVATCVLSDALGWGIVPVTVLRDDAPLGEGALQRFVDHDPEEHYFTLLPDHAERFRQFAVLDILANNTDRKGGHCLRDLDDDAVVGIDHGLTFHPVWKLRTVIWDFADEVVPDALLDDVRRVAHDLEHGSLGDALASLLSPAEVAAVGVRAADLVREGRFPSPDPGYHSVPWPLV